MKKVLAMTAVAGIILGSATIVAAEPDPVNAMGDVGLAFVDGVQAADAWAGSAANAVHDATGIGPLAAVVGLVSGVVGLACGTVVSAGIEAPMDLLGIGDHRQPMNDRGICH